MRVKQAFTLIEVLLALWIFSLSLNAFTLYYQALYELKSTNTDRQNLIGIIQLRRILSLGVDHRINDEELCMNFHTEETCFYEYEGFLMQEPGTQYYLINVEDVHFTLNENRITLQYTSEQNKFDVWIGWTQP